jgi:beta-galactosidase
VTCSARRAAAALLAFVALCAPAAAFARLAVDLTEGWRFSETAGDTTRSAVNFDDSLWSKVDLPHTWNRVGKRAKSDATKEDTYSGAAWYRLAFAAPKSPKEGRYVLEFDGVGAIADVWLNGQFIGRHQGAFARFRFDVTSAIRASARNILAVRADNSLPGPHSPTASVIPLAGDFFVYGGLYRSVRLLVVPSLHIDLTDFGGPGVYAAAEDVSDASATIAMRVRLANDARTSKAASLALRIEDAQGHVVASDNRREILRGAMVQEVTQRFTVAHPHLWSGTSAPYLYRVVATLRDPQGVVLDEVGQPLGLRTMTFDADKGFFLNGKHLFLKGVGLHQSLAGKGWAMTCEDQKRDFDLVEDIGANAVRLAHYQHDQCSYTEADRRGLVVWAEIPLVSEASFDGAPASAALRANARQQLTELIRQNYNHPSIAMWSVANEVDLHATQTNGPSKAEPLVRDLVKLAKEEDPYRPTTLADCCEQASAPNRDVLVGLTDLVGYNRYFGWYYGEEADFGTMLDKAHLAHPGLPIGVSEFGAGAAFSQHSDEPTGGPLNAHGRPHPEEVQDTYHERSWKLIAQRPYVWGAFVWNLTDFPSADRAEGDLVDMNDKGLVSHDRTIRKDAYYFFRANWNRAPILHLVGSGYVDRPYAVLDVKAYSNAATAELSLNDVALGSTPCEAGVCVWKNVHLVPGRNDFKASATVAGVPVMDAMEWQFRGRADSVRIKAGDLSGYTDLQGDRFGSDMYFMGGTGKGINPPDTPDKSAIAVAANDPRLYDSYREGRFTYRIPLPKGRYKVLLHFVEPRATQPGQRLFDVLADGMSVIHNLDVFARTGGRLRSYAQSFTATVRDHELVLDFLPRRGDALLSACEIEPL